MFTFIFFDTCFMLIVRQIVMYCAELIFKKFWSKTSLKRRALKKKLTYIIPDYYTEKVQNGLTTNGTKQCYYFYSNNGIITMSTTTKLLHPMHLFIMSFISATYLLLSYVLIGFKIDQILLIVFVNCNYFASHASRRFMIAYSIFAVYWILFDYMKAFPNYKYNTVDIANLYNTEKQLFGIATLNGTIVTPNEFFAAHNCKFLDIMCGFFYLCWIPVPLVFAIWLLYRHNVKHYLDFSLTFLLVNIIGFSIYYIYPAAPPWYVQNYGFEFVANTSGNTARLGNFDASLGVYVFNALYSKVSNVFAAMPSLHAAYPVIVLFYGLKCRLPAITNCVFASIMFGIWFSAVYTSQHYVLDVLAGILCAIFGIFLYSRLIRVNAVSNLIHQRFYRCINRNSLVSYETISDRTDTDSFDVIVFPNDGNSRTI